MKTVDFLNRHRPKMLKFMKRASPDLQGSVKVKRFVDRVNAELLTLEDPPRGRDYVPGEEVFFWCLCELEQLAEVPNPTNPPHPYVALKLETFPDLAKRLKKRRDPPTGMHLHWLGDEELDDELELDSHTETEETTGAVF